MVTLVFSSSNTLPVSFLILEKFLPIEPPPLAPSIPPTVEPTKLPTPAPIAVPAPGTMEPIAPPIQAPAAPPAAVPPVAPTALPIFSFLLFLLMPINSVPPAIKEPITGILDAVLAMIPFSAALTAVRCPTCAAVLAPLAIVLGPTLSTVDLVTASATSWPPR